MNEQPDPDALAMILLAELHKVGIFDAANLATIARRLSLSGEDELAARVELLPLANALTDPDQMRAGIHIVSGGNSEPD